jgi:hypothetical protein
LKVIVETTAYAKALVKLEEKSPHTNYWNGAGTFVVNINGVRTYTLLSTRRIAKIEEIAVTTVVSADDKQPVTKKRVARDTSLWRRLRSGADPLMRQACAGPGVPLALNSFRSIRAPLSR